MDFLPALISGIFVLVGIIVQVILNRRKDNAGANRDDAEADKLAAETRKTDTETIISLRREMAAMDDRYQKQVTELRETVNDLWDGVVIMRSKLEKANIDPGWRPKSVLSDRPI